MLLVSVYLILLFHLIVVSFSPSVFLFRCVLHPLPLPLSSCLGCIPPLIGLPSLRFMRLPLVCSYCLCGFVCVFYFYFYSLSIATMSFAGYFLVRSLQKNQNAPRLSEHPPVRGGEMPLFCLPAYLRFPV